MLKGINMQDENMPLFRRQPFYKAFVWFFETISFGFSYLFNILALSLVVGVLTLSISSIPIAGQFVSFVFWAIFVGIMMIGLSKIDKDDVLRANFDKRFFTQKVPSYIGLGFLMTLFVVIFGISAAILFPMVSNSATGLITIGLLIMIMLIALMMISFFSPLLITFYDIGVFESMIQSFMLSLKNILPLGILFSLLLVLLLVLIWLLLSMYPNLPQLVSAHQQPNFQTYLDNPTFLFSMLGFTVALTAFSNALAYNIFKDVLILNE